MLGHQFTLLSFCCALTPQRLLTGPGDTEALPTGGTLTFQRPQMRWYAYHLDVGNYDLGKLRPEHGVCSLRSLSSR